jgi:hypothetical protein
MIAEEIKQNRKTRTRINRDLSPLGGRIRASIIRDRCDLSLLQPYDEEDPLGKFFNSTSSPDSVPTDSR